LQSRIFRSSGLKAVIQGKMHMHEAKTISLTQWSPRYRRWFLAARDALRLVRSTTQKTRVRGRFGGFPREHPYRSYKPRARMYRRRARQRGRPQGRRKNKCCHQVRLQEDQYQNRIALG
jgi:hypothetical protein